VCTVGVDYSHKNSLLINQATIGFRFHMRTMWAAGFLWIHETTGAQTQRKRSFSDEAAAGWCGSGRVACGTAGRAAATKG
jgi:phage terminase large subunit-like protein